MAEPTDPAEVAALKAYDDACSKLVDLQENLPDTDAEGAVDAWVLSVYSLWQIVWANWAKAGISSRAWRSVETTLVETLPNIHEDSITMAFVEYNELVARAKQSGIKLFPLPVPEAPVRRQSPALRAGSQASSPLQTRQKSVAPPTTPRAPTPSEKTPVPFQRSPPRGQTPASSSPKGPASSSDSNWPVPVRRLANSKPKTKPLANSSSLGLRENDARLESSAWGAYNASFSHRPGPSKSSFGFSFGPATLLPSFSQPNDAGADSVNQETVAHPSNTGVLAVDAKTRSNIIPQGSSSTQGTDDEDEEGFRNPQQGQGTIDGEVFAGVGADDEVPTPSGPVPSDLAAGPPPYYRREPEISFVFDDMTEDWDPYPTIFLPRPQRSVPSEQELRRSSRPRASPAGHDAAYLAAAQGSKPKKDKKNEKNKNKGTDTTAPRKHARHADNEDETTERPAPKKPKVKDIVVVSDDEPTVATKAVRKRGPGPSKPPPVTLGVSGKGFGEKVPSSAKVVKNGIKTIGVLAVDKDFGDFIEVDKAYWNKEVAPFVGERYTEGCDHCKRLGTQCRKFLTNTVICVRCHYAKLPCKVNGVSALNPIDHYCPHSYKTLNAFLAALDTLGQHANSIEDILLNYLSGINVLSHVAGLRLQASRIRECAAVDGIVDEEDGGEDEDEEGEAPGDVAEGVAGPSKKRKHK
ncbi:hypothetical protein ARMGADRAFT_1092949 [Armillaria gallica]|uniref:Uncharacterized protein n=1 Tax=Armillaria gallica TaxID=47427 RepID=A0A2H3C973_ARMGA|nr:hypothetical protein ARMGADRAFT_1092949 [Armillaria gallica]